MIRGKASGFRQSIKLHFKHGRVGLCHALPARNVICALQPGFHYGTVLSYGISNLVSDDFGDDLVPAVFLAPFAMACSVIASTASRAA